jgi:hypothetical protein
MTLLYRDLMMKRGIRESGDLGNPPVTVDASITLPVGSIYHYFDIDRREFGEGDPIIERNVVKKVVELAEPADFRDVKNIEVRARKHVFAYDMARRRFFQEHRDLQNAELSRRILKTEQKALYVVDYNYLLEATEFNDSNLHTYERFSVIWTNIVAGITRHDIDGRQHFLLVHVPDVVPPLTLLNEATNDKEVRASTMNKFRSDEAYLIWHLHLWLEGDTRSFFSTIDAKIVDRLNIVWQSGRRWTVMNLGLVKKWVKSPENKKALLTIDQAQRKLLVTLVTVGTVADTETTVIDVPVVSQEITETKKTAGLYSRPSEKGSSVQPELLHVVNHEDDTVFSTDETDEQIQLKSTKEADVIAEIERKASEVEEDKKAISTYVSYEPPSDTSPESIVIRDAERLARAGLITAMQLRGQKKMATKYQTIAPRADSKETLGQLAVIPDELLAIPDEVRITKQIDGVPDESMMFSSLVQMDRQYVKSVLPRDLAGMVLSIQKAGVSVTDYDVKRVTTLHDDYEVHSVRINPIIGAQSTIRFRVPVVKPDGTYLANGTVCRMRKQRSDIPIRKVSPSRVAMTSYYSKMFVFRSEMHVNNYDQWVASNMMRLAGSSECKDIHFKDCHVRDVELPPAYFAVSTVLESFVYKGVYFSFDYTSIDETFKGWKDLSPTGAKEIPFGKDGKGVLYVVNRDSGKVTKRYPGDSASDTELGKLESFFGLDLAKKPYEVIDLSLFGKKIPLGLVLARYIGLGTFLTTIGCQWRTVAKGKRSSSEEHETMIRFSDETLFVKWTTRLQQMLINGFVRFDRAVRHHSFYLFDKPEIYGTIFDEFDITSRHTRELDLLRKMWIDPITESMLVDMNEPTDMVLLFLSAAKRLEGNVYHEQMDMSQMRDRGYERIAGITYTKVIEAVRGFNIRPLNAKAQVSMNPEDVWYSVIQDETNAPVDQSNPVQDLKDAEVVVFGGAGGRSSDTMSGVTRVYHPTGMGVVSESTVDSGDAGAITYLTANPNYNSVRGTSRRIKDATSNPARMVSSTFMLSPAIEFDDYCTLAKKFYPIV